MIHSLVNQYYQTWNRNPLLLAGFYHKNAWINVINSTHGYRVDPSQISNHSVMIGYINPSNVNVIFSDQNKCVVSVTGFTRYNKFIQTLTITNNTQSLNRYYIVSDSLIFI